MRKLSHSKLKVLSTLSANIFEVSLASLIIPAVISVDKINWSVVVLGSIAFVLSGYLSLLFADKGKL